MLRRTLALDPTQRPASARELMEALESCRRKVAHRIGVFYKLTALIGVVAIAAAATLFMVRLNRQKITSASASNIASSTSTLAPLPEKSIAVLPFENLSDDKEHAFFSDGVQDDILIKLAKIADLKVISRTSVMQYRGKQDVREIGDALRVSHVLEGTVRRSGGKVHVNAQLVDTRTDAGIWAEEYDRDLNDVFAIEAEVAQSVANRLRAKVSAREKAAMQERPTTDLVAYDFYVRAKSLMDKATYEQGKEQARDYFQAVELLNRAMARDSDFLLAYCSLAEAHD